MSEEKIYIGVGKTVKTQYGDLIKGSMHKDHINEIVKYMKANNLEWINWNMKEKREITEGKPTHYIEVDTWKPSENVTERHDVNDIPSSNKPTQENLDLPF